MDYSCLKWMTQEICSEQKIKWEALRLLNTRGIINFGWIEHERRDTTSLFTVTEQTLANQMAARDNSGWEQQHYWLKCVVSPCVWSGRAMKFLGLGIDAVTDRTEGKGTSTAYMIMSQQPRASHSPRSVTISWEANLDLPAFNPSYTYNSKITWHIFLKCWAYFLLLYGAVGIS